MPDIQQIIKKANKEFYDIVGPSYEEIDGRRSEQLFRYVRLQLESVSNNSDSDSILDLGCGNGFISRAAERFFEKRYAVDVSFRVLKDIDDKNLLKTNADSDAIPIKTGKLSAVVTFAVLHHCYSYEKMLTEIYRVLKKGGIFYSDHDIGAIFFARFKPLLMIYRAFNGTRKRYLSRFNELTDEMYHYSEYHQNGIPSETIQSTLEKVGFSKIGIQYHWYGLSFITDRIFGKRVYKKGFAPLVKIVAIK